MQYSNIISLASLLFSVALAHPEPAKCDKKAPCYTATVTKPPICPMYCIDDPNQPPCTDTVHITKTFPPPGSCPTPTTTVMGTCDHICNKCPTSTASTTACYTHTVTQTTGRPIACPLVAMACTEPISKCTTTSTVTATPPPGCAGCKTTETVTTKVKSTCPPIGCPTCTGGPTVTAGWYS